MTISQESTAASKRPEQASPVPSSVGVSPSVALEKASFVQALFNRIAGTYDLLNDCISFGMHRQWKQKACRALQLKSGDAVLDVCTGTGDLLAYLRPQVAETGRLVGLDFSEQMLAVARKRFAEDKNIQLLQGDAMALPFEDGVFDGAVISFGLRNVTDVSTVLQEMARVVRPGGWIVNLDTAPNPSLPGYWFYFTKIMPWFGKLLAMDKKAYEYLSTSSKHFDAPEQLKAQFERIGLRMVSIESLAFGSVAIIKGCKS